eukprot:TRINITY_DN65692_c0_g1_i4.p1 TRINITY_DN65692_c0_g1~~TRINITY_DN65692_c0_g1_i4.p1  ORF type:complete len:268 (-),score=11.02 TRINITY_DN65692_c0_g1_i4:146-949(-)
MMLSTAGFAVLLGFVASVISSPLTWDAIRCEVQLLDCSVQINSTQQYIPGQCYASYSSDSGGAAWMLSQDCSKVTVVTYGNGPQTGCSVSGGTTYSTINPTTCIPGFASTTRGAMIYATKKTTPAPMVPASFICHSIVKRYEDSDTTCSSSSWQITQYLPYVNQLCVSFPGATGSIQTNANCLIYNVYSTNDCSGAPTRTTMWQQGCKVEGDTGSDSYYYGTNLPSAVVPSAPSAIGGASAVFVSTTLLLVVACVSALVLQGNFNTR